MKAVVQDMKDGAVRVVDAPCPVLRSGGMLVRVRRSLISIGTDRAVVALAKKGPLGKARERPDLAWKVVNRARQDGVWSTVKIVRNLIETPIPLGYSCAGQVIAVGEDALGFNVGDRVACAGLNFAAHAEIDFVPRNLAVRIPDAVGDDEGAFVALGAIAIQGVRLARLEIGDVVVVLGLGLVGQIVSQVARCNGATVVAMDLDSAKVDLAKTLGAPEGCKSRSELEQTVDRLTNGHGADAVLVCAADRSPRAMDTAVAVSRLRGRIVVVGDVAMRMSRRALFEKEIQVTVSRSYGPGRYDRSYEERGVDYPFAYVRWTEQRNMEAFLSLLARREIAMLPLVTHRFPIDRACDAYDIVSGKVRDGSAIGILLEYPEASVADSRKLPVARSGRRSSKGGVGLGV
ncbi:MAG: oxidoreductase, partial [Candidatus Dadabacteria bacterium]